MSGASPHWPVCSRCKVRRVRAAGQVLCGLCRSRLRRPCWGCGAPFGRFKGSQFCRACEEGLAAFHTAMKSFPHKRRPAGELEAAIVHYRERAQQGLPMFPYFLRAG